MEQYRPDRIENERTFHNTRFTNEVRDAQGKYYAAVKHGTARFEQQVLQAARDADVLEYGCGSAIQGCAVAEVARSVTGIDISDVAISGATAAADKKGLSNTRYLTMDAEALTFPDSSFDLVFGRGIIHHLDLGRSFKSISRVLRPGGRAIFWEPLGHNPVINKYRAMTPDARTPDEHPLLKADFEVAKRHFQVAELEFYGLATLLSVPLRDGRIGEWLLGRTAMLDRLLFRTNLRWFAWHAIVELRKLNHAHH